jgi:Arc/MetJ family transcription regulator
MRTTLDIDPKVLKQVEKITGESSASKAVNKVLAEFVRRQSIEELIAMAGKVDWIDNWRELEKAELEGMKRQQWP